MINPDKHIRKAVYDLLTSQGLEVFDKRVPKNIETPANYVLISSQTKVLSHIGRGCVIWDCTVTLDINALQPLSYASTAVLDDIEEIIINTLSRDTVAVAGFNLITFWPDGTPKDLSFDTDTESIMRKVKIYRLTLQEGESAIEVRALEDGTYRFLEQ